MKYTFEAQAAAPNDEVYGGRIPRSFKITIEADDEVKARNMAFLLLKNVYEVYELKVIGVS